MLMHYNYFKIMVPFYGNDDRELLPLDEYEQQHGEVDQYDRVMFYFIMVDNDSREPVRREAYYSLGKFHYYTVRGLDGMKCSKYQQGYAADEEKYPPRVFSIPNQMSEQVVSTPIPKPKTRLECRWTWEGWEKKYKTGWRRHY